MPRRPLACAPDIVALNWTRKGPHWPHGHCSRFLSVRGVNWHVQVAGKGPAVLLLHGTGASTHSWRDLIAPLATRFTVIAPDLPGHGFSSPPATRQGYALPDVARSMAALLLELGITPIGLMGHSAGAAIGVRMAVELNMAFRQIFAVNGALLPLPGMPVPAFSLAARLLSSTSLIPSLVARRASDLSAVGRLIGNTGSRIGPEGMAFYKTLMADPDHVKAVLSMMGQWDLRLLEQDLPKLEVPLLLAVGGNDRTVPPAEAERVRALAPNAKIKLFPGLGHLAHEERPDLFIELLETLDTP